MSYRGGRLDFVCRLRTQVRGRRMYGRSRQIQVSRLRTITLPPNPHEDGDLGAERLKEVVRGKVFFWA